jgi:uncharacterized protein YdeI (YjbR/CyaY-like superfamily)
MDALIKKLLKIRDVKKRRAILDKKGLDNEEIEEILEQVHLQIKGKLKFPRANLMKFSRDGLAQASSKYLAEYRTWKMKSKLKEINNSLDICCGIGGDTIPMALRWKVFAVDKDENVINIAKHNLKAYNLENNVEFIQGDVVKLVDDVEFIKKIKDVDCIFFDPGRRSKERRTVKIEEYQPPLSFVDQLPKISPNICVKISPGADLNRIKYDCDIEVVSYKGEVKEALCYGWIDSIVKHIDDKSFAQRFTPRRPNSMLSQTNKERIHRLIEKKKMTVKGLNAVKHVFTSKNSKCMIKDDILRLLKKEKTTWENFQKFPESYKRIRIGWIEGARTRPELFKKRLGYFLKMTAKNKKYGMVQ